MERTDLELKNINSLIIDLKEEFGYLTIGFIKEAIRLGSLSKFGLTYKLNISVICYWIRECEKLKNSKNLNI